MKNILLAVVGLSPQVITETLFALYQQSRRIDAIHIITTRQGKEMINANLLSPRDGKYYRYLNEYDIDPESIDFGFDNVHIIKDRNGMEIDDIDLLSHTGRPALWKTAGSCLPRSRVSGV